MWWKWVHAKKTTSGICGGDVSRDESGEPPAGGLSDGRRPGDLSGRLGGGVRAHGLESACLRPDGEPLSFAKGVSPMK